MVTLFWPYISPRVAPALTKVLSTRWIGQGPKVEELEKKFADLTHAPHALAVNACTSATAGSNTAESEVNIPRRFRIACPV